jgi:hypothetical protein
LRLRRKETLGGPLYQLHATRVELSAHTLPDYFSTVADLAGNFSQKTRRSVGVCSTNEMQKPSPKTLAL